MTIKWNGEQRPIEPGFYWYRAYKADPYVGMVKVERHRDELGAWSQVSTHTGPKPAFSRLATHYRGEFSTRIPEPEEQSHEGQ